MLRRALLAACALAALASAGPAGAATIFGVTEDAGKYSEDGGAAFFSQLRDAGMAENAVSVLWDPEHPTRITEKPLLDRFVATASQRRVRVMFSVYATSPRAVAGTPSGSSHFAAFLAQLARTYPYVRDFVVHNEPNYGMFWQPQFDSAGHPAAGAAYEELLARSYDALKAVDPRITVIGLGLAAHGNDNPRAQSPSTSPVFFLRDVGAAYRRSGRTRPLMDALAYHPYPASSLNSLSTKQGWPHAGVSDLARVKQAVWDAFHDTAQPTFETGLSLKITEIGWQATVPPTAAPAYKGRENVRTTDEATQAQIYAQLVRALACDPAVTDVLFFHLVDETDLGGFQSGLLRADWSRRPAFDAVRQAISQTGGRCDRSTSVWSHTNEVVGAKVEFMPGAGLVPKASALAEEAFNWQVALVPVEGEQTRTQRSELAELLARGGVKPAAEGSAPAYGAARSAPDAEGLSAGRYVAAVLLRSAMEPSRTSLFLSPPFQLDGAPEEEVSAPAPVSAPVEPAAVAPPTVATTEEPAAPAPATEPAAPPTEAPAPVEAARPSTVMAVQPSRATKRAPASPGRTARFSTSGAASGEQAPSEVSFSKLGIHRRTPSAGTVQLDDSKPSASAAPVRVAAASQERETRNRFLTPAAALLVLGAALAAVLAVRFLYDSN